jgi:hypothetical protein
MKALTDIPPLRNQTLKLFPKMYSNKQQKHMKEIRSKVFEQMLRTRGLKYRTFLWQLRSFKYLAFAPTRGEFLESYYTLMRYLDDVVDGDAPLPNAYTDETKYLLEKIKFSRYPLQPKDEVDYLMLYCFKLAEKFGENFQAETNDILECLLFDAKRRNKYIVFRKAELMNHFFILDIRGTIRATLKVFNDDPDKFKFLEPLGTACRHQYDIEDIEADLAAGYVNISQEDCDRFGIKMDDLHNMSPKITHWLRHHAEEGITLLAEHHKVMPSGKFSRFERVVFKFVYEIPARKAFLKILSETKP